MARKYKRDSKGRFATTGSKISPSPRRLTSDERVIAEVMSSSKFRSDRQRITEMQRRGISPSTDFVAAVGRVKSKLGVGTTGSIKEVMKARKKR